MAFSAGIVVIPTGHKGKVALWLCMEEDDCCLLDFYNSYREGVVMALHFRKCSEVANDEGFETKPGFFVHPDSNKKIPIADILETSISTKRFRRMLKTR